MINVNSDMPLPKLHLHCQTSTNFHRRRTVHHPMTHFCHQHTFVIRNRHRWTVTHFHQTVHPDTVDIKEKVGRSMKFTSSHKDCAILATTDILAILYLPSVTQWALSSPLFHNNENSPLSLSGCSTWLWQDNTFHQTTKPQTSGSWGLF